MLHRESMFKKREEPLGRDNRGVNLTPGLGASRRAQEAGSARPEPPPAERHKAAALSPRRLIVGPAIKLKGVQISDCDTLVVEGSVEASMDSRVVQIAEHGVFTGTVSIEIAEIHGRFDRELTAREQLIIHSTGRMSGKIRYGKIKVEEGAEISGNVARLDARPLRMTPPALAVAGAAEHATPAGECPIAGHA